MNKKPYAIYFPQFYPSRVNDDAWGKHFTDWLLVGQANFRDLWERRAPARGFYDGSDRGVHLSQALEAKQAGLAGFGLYHYWFYTQHELPAFEQSVLSGQVLNEPDSWFLIWANESWSKRWVGNPELLIDLSRHPNNEMIEAHCKYLKCCFENPGYVKWKNRPLFVFYNLGYFDQPQKIVSSYRECLRRLGVDAALVQVVKSLSDVEYSHFMDGSYLFEPRLFFNAMRKESGWFFRAALSLFRKAFGATLTDQLLVRVDKFQSSSRVHTENQFLHYFSSKLRADHLKRFKNPYQNILCPAWNNAPRYGKRFTSLQPIEPEQFLDQLSTSSELSDLPVLINAWNEWSEGAAIEPCAYYGSRYLDMVKKFADLDCESSKINISQ